MKSILLSKIESIELIKNKQLFNNRQLVAILPWSFPLELNSLDEYFKKGERRYNKYINSLKTVGIKEKNIFICDCYTDSKEKIKDILKKVDVIVLTGGNPEMLYSKIVHEKDLLYDIKYSEKIIIGESAGACLHFKRYFINKYNNYYGYTSFYDGLGIIDNKFDIDVHTQDSDDYINELKKIKEKTNRTLYTIYDDGLIIYDRKNKHIEKVGHIGEIWLE